MSPHVDHILPRSRFPQYELDISNMQVLCEHCNTHLKKTKVFDLRTDEQIVKLHEKYNLNESVFVDIDRHSVSIAHMRSLQKSTQPKRPNQKKKGKKKRGVALTARDQKNINAKNSRVEALRRRDKRTRTQRTAADRVDERLQAVQKRIEKRKASICPATNTPNAAVKNAKYGKLKQQQNIVSVSIKPKQRALVKFPKQKRPVIGLSTI